MRERAQLDLPPGDLRLVMQILFSHVPDRPVYAFGSRATGQARRRSDLDLAIGGPLPLTLRQRALLTEEFSESDLPIRVEFVDLNVIDPQFMRRIERDFIPIQTGVVEKVLA